MTQVVRNPEGLTAAALYDGLIAAANGNAQRLGTLHRLKQACDALVAGGKDFALKDIEVYCKATFGKGPNAQSISNDKALRAYVDARRGDADLARRGKARSPLDQDIEAIPDLDLRSRMRLLAEDYRLQQKRFRILTEGLAKLTPPLDLGVLLSGGHPAAGAQTPEALNARVTDDQVAALGRVVGFFLDAERVRRAGLDVDGGDVIGRGLRETVAEGRDITLLETLLSALKR
ncbi:hypothetical protein [Magnetospirillum aberrantis]|uniref:Uncharacterized protein n=1 Tax=Magnetospirillum aberrantis SpK TaxID=908842 RepID=A0A7C9US49_9PROT|nr:hypothetical protein [Magnetospirillum aberrantis]NFV79068.1 hypothetical protein [Magnetospirillum aberrantis SpK]